MRRTIITTALLICAIAIHGQPIFLYSQFELDKKFSAYIPDVKKTYEGDLINAFAPKENYLLVKSKPQLLSLRQHSWVIAEKEIPVRHIIDSMEDTTKYLLLCPKYNRSEKIMVGVFTEGFEAIWGTPNEDVMYVVHRVSHDRSLPSFIGLIYRRGTHDVDLATHGELEAFYKAMRIELYNTYQLN